MYCPNCGASIDTTQTYCSTCGAKLKGNRKNTNDEILIDAYIGKNADELKNGSFSFNTLFFGNIYVLYRKMWLLGLIWYAIKAVVTLFLPFFSLILTIATNIIMAIKFKELYLNNVKEQVQKIKDENPDKSTDELIAICSKKGGTTLIPIIALILAYLLTVIISAILIYNVIKQANEERFPFFGGNLNTLQITIPKETLQYNIDKYFK